MLLKALLAGFNSIIYGNFIATENRLSCISKEPLKFLLIFKEKQLKRHYLISVFLVISILWVVMLAAVASIDIKENEIVLRLHSVMVIFSFIRQLTHKLHQEKDDPDVTNEWMIAWVFKHA